MALKKNDKIIAIAGVLVLIIAALSIFFLYIQSPAKEVNKATSEEKIFYVTWTKTTKEKTITGSVSKKTLYTEPINVAASSTGLVGVLTNVEIQLTWNDVCTYGLRHNKGLDTLTASIYQTGGKPGDPDVTVGEGNSTFPSFEINSVPTLDQVTAVDIDAANSIIKENFSGKDTASFDTKITIKYGEKILRPLKFLKEKGDSFNLKITYTYYIPVVTEESGDYQAPPETPSVPHEALMTTTGSGIHW
ncbi:MAG: hypothetical protein NTV74_03960 [Euryarchaeota archaeon]|nr:hypothetical protein [Euryarchaeota archaeon]